MVDGKVTLNQTEMVCRRICLPKKGSSKVRVGKVVYLVILQSPGVKRPAKKEFSYHTA